MNYFISRENQQYGPYTLADLQRYVGTGEVLTSDLATSEGMGAPVTVGEIIGNIAAPPAYSTAYPASAAFPVATIYPAPPNLHWGLVLLFTVLTCGLYSALCGSSSRRLGSRRSILQARRLSIYIVGDCTACRASSL